MKAEIDKRVEVVFHTDQDFSHFFGYYDKSPLNSGGNLMLAHRVSFDGRPVTENDKAEVGYYDLDSGEWYSLGQTRAFNWQQGAMLQWLPPDYASRVIYNDRKADQFVSVIVDVETGQREVIPFPVYAVHPSGTFALAANYERLYFCRPGYNYQGVVKPKWDRPIHEEDGIFRVDLRTGDVELLISTRQVCDMGNLPSGAEQYNHWLEHMMWNPSGSRFAFLHRWDDPPGGHTTRLFTANADGSDIYMFPDTGFYSHMGWRTDDEFTIWTLKPKTMVRRLVSKKELSLLRRIVRPPYRWVRDHLLTEVMQASLRKKLGGEQAYLQMWDRSDKVEVLGENVLTHNGHNTWSPINRNIMLTDTYADDEQFRHLLLYFKDVDKVVEIGRFYSPFNESVYRCDLHPRWSRRGRQVIIDSAHEGRRRQMYVLDIEQLLDDCCARAMEDLL